MNKKISLGLALALIFLSIALTVSVTMTATMHSYNSIIKDIPSRSKLYSSVSELDDIVRNHYYGEINESLLNAEISSGYANGIGDRYSYHMTAAEYAVYQDEIAGQKIGIGIIPFYHPGEMVIYAAEVSANSPAALMGLQKGDKITAIDDEPVTAYNYKELQKKMTGDKLSKVNITYRRGDGAPTTVGIVKGYTAQTVYTALNGNIGYVKITEFYDTTAKQLKKAIDGLLEQGASALIFDVRNCSDGTVAAAASTLDVLVPVASEGTGALATAKAKDGTVKTTFTADADSIAMPMMVLVNDKTAGPAELFACDLRDYGKAQLIGEKTGGNGTLQEAFPLSDGGAILLTTALIEPYVSPTYNIEGLTPDKIVELSAEQKSILPILAQEDDAQYQAAFQLLDKENNADT